MPAASSSHGQSPVVDATAPKIVMELYNRWAPTYDTEVNKTRDLDGFLVQKNIETYRGKKVLEPGCGTGKNTIMLKAVAKSVTALDNSAEMLALAAARSQGDESAADGVVTFGTVDLSAAGWERPLIDAGTAGFDIVSFHLVLEHLQELGIVFTGVRALLQQSESKEDKLLVFQEFHPFRQQMNRGAKFKVPDTVTGEVAEVRLPTFVHHVSEYFSQAAQNGFELVDLSEHWDSELMNGDKNDATISLVSKSVSSTEISQPRILRTVWKLKK